MHTQITVRRSTLMEDAFRALAGMGPALKARLIVTFVNEQGLRCVGGTSAFDAAWGSGSSGCKLCPHYARFPIAMCRNPACVQ